MKIRITSPSTDFEILSCKVLTLLRLYKGGISCHKEVPTHEINFNAINIYYWPTVTMLWEVLCLQRVKDTGLEFLCYLHLFTWPKTYASHSCLHIGFYFLLFFFLCASICVALSICTHVQYTVCVLCTNKLICSYLDKLCKTLYTSEHLHLCRKNYELGCSHICTHEIFIYIYIYIVYSFIRWICKAHLSRLSDSELNSR